MIQFFYDFSRGFGDKFPVLACLVREYYAQSYILVVPEFNGNELIRDRDGCMDNEGRD